MSRLPVPGSDDGTWGDVLNDFLRVEHNSDGSLKSTGSLAGKAEASSVVLLTGDQTVDGVKSFSSSPIVPTPGTGTAAANKTYVDTGLTAKVPTSRTVSAGTGLTGGGDLSANRSLAVNFGTSSNTVAAGDDSRITGALQAASNLADLSDTDAARSVINAAPRASLTYVKHTRTAGDISFNPGANTWSCPDTSLDITMYADAGQVVLLHFACRTSNENVSLFGDVVTRNTGANVSWVGNGTAAGGLTGAYIQYGLYGVMDVTALYTLVPGDIDYPNGAQVTFRLMFLVDAAQTRTIRATSAIPLLFEATLLG